MVGGCADTYVPKGEPSFYRNLAQPERRTRRRFGRLDDSGYRANNGFPAVTLDPELMRVAQAQAEVMAKRDKLDHGAGKPFVQRLKASGYDAKTAAEKSVPDIIRWPRHFPAGATQLRTAQYAPGGCHPHGIAAIYTPASKYKVYWSLIVAQPDDKKE